LLLNALRWVMTIVLLLCVVLIVRGRRGIDWRPAMRHWRIYPLLGVLSVTAYNSLQYMALRSTTAIDATLIGIERPAVDVAVGGTALRRAGQPGGLAGCRGLVLWRAGGDDRRRSPAPRVARSGPWRSADACGDAVLEPVFVAAASQAATGRGIGIPHRADPRRPARMRPPGRGRTGVGPGNPAPGWATLAVVFWVAAGPSLLAYWCWDRGIARAGTLLPVFFANLTPLFAALMSALMLGESPAWHHGLAFALIAGGIVLAQWRPRVG
jgi:hypothetical protein